MSDWRSLPLVLTCGPSWYQERTGAEVRPIAEPIFVAATWIYELAREAGLSPDAFIQRFADRLEELGLTAAARAALAFNSHGLKAPEGLFSSLESSLDSLVSEGVYRLSRPGEGACWKRVMIAPICCRWVGVGSMAATTVRSGTTSGSVCWKRVTNAPVCYRWVGVGSMAATTVRSGLTFGVAC